MPSTTTIPFSQIKFDDDLPTLQAVEERLTKTLRTIRTDLEQRAEPESSDRNDNSPSFDDQIRDTDRAKIKRRATLYLVRAHTATGTDHLADTDKVKLAPLRDGLPVARVQTEHEADEIAAALHAEMPWMGPATKEVWHGLRASVRGGRLGLRFNPLVLVGSPGIGKSHWARRLAEHLTVPVTKNDASNEPATFSLVGVQRGWGSAAPGKLMATVLRERHAGPLVIIDEIEKTGDVNAVGGSRHTLTYALLPLLERMTAETWECPYFQVRVDMSWCNWVLIANSRMGLPEPL